MNDWKTTVIGLVGAVLVAIGPALQKGEFDTSSLVNAAVVAALGYFARDSHD